MLVSQRAHIDPQKRRNSVKRPWSSESNVSPSNVRTTYIIRVRLKVALAWPLVLYSVLLNAALRCFWWSKMLGEQSKISFAQDVAVRCSVKCSIRFTTLPSLLLHAQLTLFSFNSTPKFRILWCTAQELKKSRNVGRNAVFIWRHYAEQRRARWSTDEQVLCAAWWNVGFVLPGPRVCKQCGKAILSQMEKLTYRYVLNRDSLF